MPKKSKISITARFISRLLQSRYEPVRAMERALRIQGIVQFAGLSFFLIIAPSLVLAYFGINSIKDQEESAIRELRAAADVVSRSFSEELVSEFGRFESRIKLILGSGRSPLSSIHQNQRITLRFDKDQELVAPFLDIPIDSWSFHKGVRHSNLLSKEMQQIRQLSKKLEKGNQELQEELVALKNNVFEKQATGGGKIRHILTLKEAQISSDEDRQKLLQNLVDNIINTRWHLHDGTQGAIARRALSELRQSSLLSSKIGGRFDELQSRIDERIQELYWTQAWEREWRKLVQLEPRNINPGDIVWTVSEKGLWGRFLRIGRGAFFGESGGWERPQFLIPEEKVNKIIQLTQLTSSSII